MGKLSGFYNTPRRTNFWRPDWSSVESWPWPRDMIEKNCCEWKGSKIIPGGKVDQEVCLLESLLVWWKLQATVYFTMKSLVEKMTRVLSVITGDFDTREIPKILSSTKLTIQAVKYTVIRLIVFPPNFWIWSLQVLSHLCWVFQLMQSLLG